MKWLLPCILFLTLASLTTSTINVEIISLLPYDINVATALIWTGAAFDLAVLTVNEKYWPFLNVSLRLMYNASDRNCDDTSRDALRKLSEYYYTQTNPQSVYALVSTPCTDSIGVKSVANQWDWLLFTNGLAQEDFLNDTISPTAMAMGGTFRGYAVVVTKLLLFYQWRHVTILLQAKTITTAYSALASTLLDYSRSAKTFEMDSYTFQPDNKSMANALIYAKKRSRVMVIFAQGSVTLELLLMADSIDMANGEYVFINVQPLQQDSYGRVTLFNYPHTRNLKVFQSFFFIAYHSVGGQLQELNSKIRDKAKVLYNSSYETGNQPLDSYSVQASYDLVEIIAATVNETNLINQTKSDWSGRVLANQMCNRTYVGLTTGDIYISNEGARYLDLDVFGFSTTTQTMQLLTGWSWLTRRLSWTNMTVKWPTRDGQPPLNVPRCGFSGLVGHCAREGMTPLLSIILPTVMGIGILTSLVLFIRHVYIYRAKHGHRNWLITHKDLINQEMLDGANNSSSVSINWNNRRVWTRVVLLKQPPSAETFRILDILLHPIQHPNINTLFGLCFLENRAIFVSNYCKHGSLSDLFNEMSLDWDFKYSLLADLVEGLCYIHTTLGRFHGHLQGKTCLVDERFTLRIAELDCNETLTHLTQHSAGARMNDLWIPPEILKLGAQRSRESEVFVFGLLIVTIMVESEPKRLESAVHGCLVEVPADCPSALGVLIEKCAAEKSVDRPAMPLVKRIFNKMEPIGNMKGHNIIDRVLARYSSYTATLEAAVRERSEELNRERLKCDEILQQMLPVFVVEKLRSHRAMETEFFESATIYFSDLVGFTSWVSVVSPYTVIELLNLIYTIFDGEIAHYGVQKVETVGDSYMVVSGIPVKNGDAHASEICRMAVGLMKNFNENAQLQNGLLLRVGIHSGSCAAGVIGTKVPRYCLFGDAVNIASRMETHGQGSRIHLSFATATLIVQNISQFSCIERGIIPIKGKGHMQTYWLSY